MPTPTVYTHAQPRLQTDKNGERPSVMDFVVQVDAAGALVTDGSGNQVQIYDGATHPLSDVFSTLGNAQAVYPHAVALTDELAWAAIQGGINAVQTRSAGALYIPPGTFLINRTLTITASGMRLSGDSANATIIVQTAATGGLLLPTSQQKNCVLENFQIRTTNSGGTKAIKCDVNEGTGNIIRNVAILASGAGKWVHGLWLKDFESSLIDAIYIPTGVDTQIHMEGNSNSTMISSPTLAHANVVALEIDTAIGVIVVGGTIEGTLTAGTGGFSLIRLTTGAELGLLGTYLENHGDIPFAVVNDSTLTAESVELGGGSCSECFYANGGGILRLAKIKGFTSATAYLVRSAGNGFGSAQGSTITDSQIYNAGSGDGILLANQLAGSIANCTIIALNGNGVQIDNCQGPVIRDCAINTPHVGKYGVLTDGGSVIIEGCWLNVNGSLAANICNNTYISPAGNYLFGVGQVVPAATAPTYAGLTIDGAVAPRPINYTTSGSLRWKVECVGDPESGGNAGSSLWLQAYADDGVTVLGAVKFDRATTGMILPGALEADTLELVGATVGGGGVLAGGAYGATVDIIVGGATRHLLCL